MIQIVINVKPNTGFRRKIACINVKPNTGFRRKIARINVKPNTGFRRKIARINGIQCHSWVRKCMEIKKIKKYFSENRIISTVEQPERERECKRLCVRIYVYVRMIGGL